MTTPAVAVTGMTKTFPVPFQRRSVVAVRDLTFRVEAGEVYGLLGPNGSGKSTTLKIILGLVAPSRGKAEIFGQESNRVASREAVGFLPESPYFPKYLTGAEMLRFYGKLGGLRGAGLTRRIAELLEVVGLTDARDRRLSGYSKGMLQRIGLAQALIHEPRLVVLDEPTAGVDPAGAREIRELILDLKKRGISVLLSSHLLDQVEEICDRVGILAQGVLVREGALEELLVVENQTELVLANASAELIDEIAALAQKSGTRLVQHRRPRTTLEQVFLEATQRINPEKRRTSNVEHRTSN
jgi:ABC-2 type transport system ATP-binding protein